MAQQKTYLSVSPDLEALLIDNGISLADLVRRTGQPVEIMLDSDPAELGDRRKEPVTILVASAAVIAALTPLLKETIRTLARRDPVIRERRLLPVEDSEGNVLTDKAGRPLLQWVDVVKGELALPTPETLRVKGFGMEISLGDQT